MAEKASGKPIEEMTHAEYVEYLEEEAQKQADHNAEQFAKVEEAYKPFQESGTGTAPAPTTSTNDELRAENAEAVDAELDAVTGGGENSKAPAPKKPFTPLPPAPAKV